ncbi:histidine phosphatase family protein [Alkalimarinus sediminis]|uniref:Histidine phosphatase family protein n=1 Tax=Alkalimarinus sediminis TaxID=1632866 RepID=A0A9E8HLK4_9ALTE|nr:histidine phosphatase family protein [Alkalimarinus sediminis]UZW75582.1 histidine phosphatase family protein [Alkalimarinus sediminis]
MGAIYLVRHGQASFGKADYDKLSDKGCKQSEILGEAFGKIVSPDRFYSGNLLRHEQTANHFMSGFGGSSIATVTHSGFNEFNHVEVLVKYRPEWKDFSVMAADIAKQPVPQKAFQQAFSDAVIRWVSGNHDDDYQETWRQFQARCNSALQSVIEQSSEAKNIVIFTSGGPISVILQQILKLGDRETLSVNEVLVNTGVTKLLFSGDRLSLSYLNNHSHLEMAGSSWVTYR